MGIKLVPYHKDEAAELAAAIKEYFPDSPFHPTAETIAEGGIRYFRCFQDEVQVGFSGYYLKTPYLAETVKTAVFKSFRGQKFGMLISEAIEKECQRVGVKKVMTTIYHFNHVMISIKLKQGYTIEGYHPDHEAPGFHEYSLGKVL